MKHYIKDRRIRFSVTIIAALSLSMLQPGFASNSSDNFEPAGQMPLVVTETRAAESTEYFRLVETRIIDAELLDDQMLDTLSPSLVAPRVVKFSPMNYSQRMLNDYHNSVCFKRCHTKNDFSASDYTYEQWCLLIENDGHSIFSEIPWENPDTKNQLFKYLVNNAKNATPDPEGIGEWN